MKKILFIIPTLTQTNGVAAFMINYIKYFKLNSFKVEVIYNDLRTSKSYLEFFQEKNIPTYKLSYVRKVGLKKYCEEIETFFDKHNDYDLIYSNVSYQTYFFYREAKKHGINKFAIHAHATKSSDNRLKNIFGDIIQKKLNKCINYKFACSDLAGKAMFKKDRFEIINNAIDYEKFKFDANIRNKIRKRLKINDDQKIIGFVGRYTPQKNVFFFINLIEKLPEDFKILMIGNGQQKQDFINKVEEKKLENRFILIDETPNVNEYYSSFDYFVLPSLYEGLPVVGIEAQANGLPVMFSDTITKECKISNNVYYLDKNDLNQWVDKLEQTNRTDKLILNPSFDIRIQANNYEKELKKIC